MIEDIRKVIETWLQQRSCQHRYRYSRSKPGTLVCRDCRKRRRPDAQVFR
jgi:hypothetical protein